MITNDMTDEARDEAFARVKNSVLDAIFGTTVEPVHDEVEKRVVDFKFGTDTCWMDQTRITAKLNNDMNGVPQNVGYHEKRIFVRPHDTVASKAELQDLEEHFNGLKIA